MHERKIAMEHILHQPQEVLKSLGLSDSEIAVYLAMRAGLRTARDLIKATRLPRPTVYYVIGTLEKRGLVGKSGGEGEKRFTVAPPERLVAIAHERALEAQGLEARAAALTAQLGQSCVPDHTPAVAFYEGVDAVKSAAMESIYCKSKEICSVAPQENFFHEVGADFVELYLNERRRRGIKTRNLWEHSVDMDIVRNFYEGFSDVRIVPPVMRGQFHSTIFLYDNKTLVISSLRNAYCVLITSQEHHDTMQAWFEGLWSASKPHPKK